MFKNFSSKFIVKCNNFFKFILFFVILFVFVLCFVSRFFVIFACVLFLLVLILFVAALPGILLLVSAGFDVERARAGLEQTAVNGSRVAAGALYFVILTVFLLWAGARLLPLMPVIVNERRGLGAIARSFALTRGSTLKLVWVILLYAIVVLVAMVAVGSVFGLIARLVLGEDQAPAVAFVAAAASGVLTTGFTVLQMVFEAQFYLAARARLDGDVATASA